MKVLYATDMDRTMVFSHRFIEEYPPVSSYEVAETHNGKIISYISSPVKKRLNKINSKDGLYVVPVTTRSIDEFNRINLGLNPKYAIVSNGGTILKNGEPLEDWEEYIKSNSCMEDLMKCMLDLDELDSVDRATKVIDGKYLFNKTNNGVLFDSEVALLAEKYPNLQFTRQRAKIYVIPKSFSKAIALRWLQHKLECDKLVASGDSELDLPMLAIADYAVIPEHGDLISLGFVTEGRIVNGGIDSPLQTFDIVEKVVDDK